jgi:hypothetical protein
MQSRPEEIDEAIRRWLLITVSPPRFGSSTLRLYARRKLRSLGAHYLQQSVCLLPATPTTTRATTELVTRLRAEVGHGNILRIQLKDAKQEQVVVDAIRRERTDEYHELVESTRQFHEELELERRRGRVTYTELEESQVDLARYQKWLAVIGARDYFHPPEANGRSGRRGARRGPRAVRDRGPGRGARRSGRRGRSVGRRAPRPVRE